MGTNTPSTRRILIIAALVNTVCGWMYGYAIGFVPIYTTFNSINTDCTSLTGPGACSNVKHAECIWANPVPGSTNVSDFQCLFNDYETVQCGLIQSIANCSATPRCRYSYSNTRCEHQPSWQPWQTGLYASAMIIGGGVGSIGVNPFLAKIGRKKSLYLTAIVAVVSSILATLSRSDGSYWLLIAARFIMGVASGAACVIGPIYAEEMLEEKYSNPMICIFQIFCTFGIFNAAALGLIMNPSDLHDNLHMEFKFQFLNGFQWFTCLVIFPVAYVMPESDVWLKMVGRLNAADENETTPLDASAESLAAMKHKLHSVNRNSALPNPPAVANGKSTGEGSTTATTTKKHRFERRTIAMPLIIATSLVLSISQQFTGINAVMNYAPTIMSSAGLAPLTGNFVVMLWNFITSIIAVPAARKFSARRLYIAGTAIASIACLINGLPVYPGLLTFMSHTTRQVFAGLGIFIFIAAFEIAMGPVFYMLAVEMFPRRVRSLGCAFTNMSQFIMNIVINFAFPVSVVALSGGPSADQDKGNSLMFIIFGITGLATLPMMVCYLYPADDDVMEESDGVGANAAAGRNAAEA